MSPAPRTMITWGQYLGREECPYLRRWAINFGLFSVRLHHWYSSDDKRHKHDHPSWFITLVLKGKYADVGDYTDHLRPGSIRFRGSNHYVDVAPGGCWSLLIFGRKSRDWGFWVPRKLDGILKFKKSNKYFLEHGHHPCELPNKDNAQ